MNELSIKKAEAFIKGLALIGVAFGAYQGYLTYVQKAELQAMRALHEVQMKTCERIVKASTSLMHQDSFDGYSKALTEFSVLKHGVALTFLDVKVIDKASDVYNVAVELFDNAQTIDALEKQDESLADSVVKDLAQCYFENKPFELALACRESISKSYRAESGSDLSPLSEQYTMGWVVDCAREKEEVHNLILLLKDEVNTSDTSDNLDEGKVGKDGKAEKGEKGRVPRKGRKKDNNRSWWD